MFNPHVAITEAEEMIKKTRQQRADGLLTKWEASDIIYDAREYIKDLQNNCN